MENKIIINDDLVIKDYREFLEENGLENTTENIDLYITGLYYDIMDNLALEYGELEVPKELQGYEAEEYIEEKIKEILMKEV